MNLDLEITLLAVASVVAFVLGFILGLNWKKEGDTPMWKQAAANAQKANPSMRRGTKP